MHQEEVVLVQNQQAMIMAQNQRAHQIPQRPSHSTYCCSSPSIVSYLWPTISNIAEIRFGYYLPNEILSNLQLPSYAKFCCRDIARYESQGLNHTVIGSMLSDRVGSKQVVENQITLTDPLENYI